MAIAHIHGGGRAADGTLLVDQLKEARFSRPECFSAFEIDTDGEARHGGMLLGAAGFVQSLLHRGLT